ncbi:DUF3050 domain-containing protein [Litoribacter alkaliphilus]|uniref:DUF3050 domain-containing protein n=1 Tax=Litoribacter ruber TaxID=702568 RepID=A0AAP2CGY0_9BACT|nr:DUF3050 domain-containing protein [Litoribacter alkaliphilus]MBS9524533.1 DUF3050 domain-containing protein [Litoribacter alkaliphilus]
MNSHFDLINNRIAPLREQIINHPVYAKITDLEDLKVFMEHHVFAVWDFMSLLKSLQINLTCTSIPWFPKADANTTQLINEIVLGEESDIDQHGERKSHYVLYLEAMQQCGANTASMEKFAASLQANPDFTAAYEAGKVNMATQEFINFTFDIIQNHPLHTQAAVFTFGREDLIPDMFISIVRDIHARFPDQVSILKYYLERHIEVDGDHHGNLSLEMTAALCGVEESNWIEAADAVEKALQMRLKLWDAVQHKLTF